MSNQDEIRTDVIALCRALDAAHLRWLERIQEVVRQLATGQQLEVAEGYNGAQAHFERLIAQRQLEAAARYTTRVAEGGRPYRDAWQALYPNMERTLALLRNGDRSMAEWAIAYVEADPWHFHSGYFKQKLMRALRRVPLSEEQRERLRAAVLAALLTGKRQEQNETRSLSRRLDSPAFRQALARIAEEHENEATRERAEMTLAACRLNDVHHDLRGAVNRRDSSA